MSKKKVFTIDKMYGVRLSDGIIGDKKHASYMKNMISDGGVNRKRHGLLQVAHFGSDAENYEINGIHEYKNSEGVSQFVVHAATKLYLCKTDFSEISELTVQGGSISNAKSTSFFAGGRLFICGGGKLLAYDGEKVFPVYASPIAYVPTTRTGIGVKGSENENGFQCEELNMLTPRKKNKMSVKISADSKTSGIYSLDSPIKKNTTVSFAAKAEIEKTEYSATRGTAKILTSSDIAGVDLYADSIKALFGVEDAPEWKISAIGVEVTVVLAKPMRTEKIHFARVGQNPVPRVQFTYLDSTTFDTQEPISPVNEISTSGAEADCIHIYSGGENVSLKGLCITARELYVGDIFFSASATFTQNTQSIDCTVKDADGNVLDMYQKALPLNPCVYLTAGGNGINGTVSSNFYAPYSVQNNMELVFESPYNGYDSTIDRCSFGAQFTNSYLTTEFILSGNADRKNEAFYSEKSDTVGAFCYFPVTNKLTFGTENEAVTSLLRLSDSSMGVFKKDGFYRVEFTDPQRKVALYEYQSADGSGAVNPYTSKNVNSDSLVLGSLGVCGVDAGSSLSAVSRRMRIRSSNINAALLKKNLAKAVACECDGRYWLFLNDECGTVYIGDTRYKNHDGVSLDSSFEYEWYVFEDCFATCVTVWNRKIFMGRENGVICTFSDTYADVFYKNAKANDFVYDYENGIFTFNDALSVNDGDTVRLGEHLARITDGVESYSGGEAVLKAEDFFTDGGYVSVCEGDTVKISLADGSFSSEEYIVTDADAQNRTITLSPSPVEVVGIYVKKDTEKYVLQTQGGGFCLNKNGKCIRLGKNGGLKVAVEQKKNVEAVYVTFPFDLGTHARAKNLHAVSVCADGAMQIGYVTRKNNFSKTLFSSNGNFDFADTDFCSFSFTSDMASGTTVRVFERGFNYIKFVFRSEGDCEFSPVSLAAVYTENDKISLGVR